MQEAVTRRTGSAGDDAVWLSRVAERLAEGIVLVRAGIIAGMSERASRLCGLESASAAVGRPFSALFADGIEPGAAGEEPIERVLAGPDPNDERRVIVHWLDAPATDEALYALEDVTARRRVEAESFANARALHRAQRQIAALEDRHSREASEREQLLTVVSHELRTPVTVIAGYNRLLLGEKVGPLNPEQQRFLRESNKSCQRLSYFIGNLLEAAREVSGEGALEVCEIPIGSTIEGVVTNLKPLLEEHQLGIRLALDPSQPRARFDPLRIEQVVTNLIGNAIKFASVGSTIDISSCTVTHDQRPFVEVSVADRGPGIAAEDRERIFEPYVRVGEGSGAGGLGLGLSICRRIVVAHGGSIRQEPRKGGGSCFVFRLPAADGVTSRDVGDQE